MPQPSLQAAIDAAGSPIDLLWKPEAPNWSVPVVAPEYTGWASEQIAWRTTVTISDLSHHMSDLFIEGPDAKRLLSDYSANNYESFEIGQAKQFVPVTEDGKIVTDGILMRIGVEKFSLTGVPAAQTWVRWHGETGGYDVEMTTDPDSSFRKGDPVLFRYQVQGPRALDVVAEAFGGPLPKTKFFHSADVTLGGRKLRALRHGMTGMPGYEFIGDYADGAYVKEALMKAGEPFDMEHVGGKAYFTNGIESGWIPTPTPAIYTKGNLKAYREWLPVFSYEGQKPLNGSFWSENIEDYYVSPWELGYGKGIHPGHDFHGRDALMAEKDEVRRVKVTLELNPEDVARTIANGRDYYLSYSRYAIEAGGTMQGMTFWTGYIAPVDRILALSLIDRAYAEPGSQVELVWGQHPGKTAPEGTYEAFPRIRATVHPSPYSHHARTAYRKN